MIDLLKFYKENIKENDYYYTFYNELIVEPEKKKNEYEAFDWFDYEEDTKKYEIFDEEDAIKKFRDLCEPDLTLYKNYEARLFILISYFLNKNGYVIKEFPRILERLPQRITDFTVNDIRNRAFALKLNDGTTIHYQTRRSIVQDLHFEKKLDTNVSEDLNLKFQEISTRNARFENMSTDEKIKEIINLIENLLKDNGNYIKLDYEKLTLNTINEQQIIDFKKRIQCFRHSSEEALQERKTFTDNQKKFIIDYGIMICNLIYYNKK